MGQVILLDLGQTESIGLKHLQHSLQKKGIDCEIISFQEEIAKGYHIERGGLTYQVKNLNDSVKATTAKIDKLKEKMQEASVIGISFIGQFEEASVRIPIARYVKSTFPKQVLIGGGPGITSDASKIFRAAKLDYAIKGEGEEAFPKLIRAILSGRKKEEIQKVEGIVYQKGRKVIETKSAQLTREKVAALPFVYAKQSKDEINILTERGCPNACVFCTVPRKGKPAHINDNTIIEGLKELAKNPEIKTIHFANDQLFLNETRAKNFLNALIQNKLSERFRFVGIATVEAFLKSGKPNLELISLMKRANFGSLTLGVEAFNDNMIRELKGGRFTAVQAIKILDAINASGIQAGTFRLAAGIHTTPKEFLESYYRATVRNIRRLNELPRAASMIEAWGKMPIAEKAKREGLLYKHKGEVKSLQRTNPKTPVFVLPKDAALQTLFKQFLKQGRRDFRMEDIAQIIHFAKTQLPQNDPQIKKLLQLQGRMIEIGSESRPLKRAMLRETILKEAKKRFGNTDKKNLDLLVQDKQFVKTAVEHAEIQATQYNILARKAQKQTGIERLRTLAKGRKQFGRSIFTRPSAMKLK